MGRKKNKHPRKNYSVSANTDKNEESVTEDTADSSILSKLSISEVGLQRDGDTKREGMSQENEINFATYLQNGERFSGREYYVHSLCQLCKKDLPHRYSCERCGLLNYCSPEHRRLHWPEHTELCTVVQTVCRARGSTHILQGAPLTSPDAFRALRLHNMQDCELAISRPLDSWEKEMFIFPHVCVKCHEYRAEALVICRRCNHSGFCKGHRPDCHDDSCAHLLRYKEIIKDQNKFGVSCPTIPPSLISSTLPKLTCIDNTFNSIRSAVGEIEFLELTEIVTYPLTVLNALLTINDSRQLTSKKLLLHVVGAERSFETNKLEKWEYYVLHLIPDLRHLEIVFIGPELNTVNNEDFKVCSRCSSTQKSITFKFETRLYHELTKVPKPDLVCVFNPGLYRITGFNGQDTWKPTIASIFRKNCPVLTTSYTEKEIFMDVDRVKSVQNVRLDREPTLNPFSSLKPNLNFVSEEESPVIFKNQFYCIMSQA